MTACFTVMALDPTLVANAFATSFAPMPYACGTRGVVAAARARPGAARGAGARRAGGGGAPSDAARAPRGRRRCRR